MSNIQWTNETWNPVVGCTRASRGCDHCYAVQMTHRLGAMAEADRAKGKDPGKKAMYEGLTVLNNRGDRHFNGTVRTVEDALTIPLGWKKPRKVFVNSMSDLFHKDVPFEFIDRVFAVMALCPKHTFQILTKRPDRMAKYFSEDRDREVERAVLDWHHDQAGLGYAASNRLPEHPLAVAQSLRLRGVSSEYRWPLPNVWLGTSVEGQGAADERIPHLLRCPAAVRFLSCEPLLGSVDLSAFMGGEHVVMPGDRTEPNYNFGIHWVIVGGESGKGARPCDIDWIRSIIGQCRDARVACFVKQLGRDPRQQITSGGVTVPDRMKLADSHGGVMEEWPTDLRVREMPEVRQ